MKWLLDAMSVVPRAEFDGWTQPQRMALLVNVAHAALLSDPPQAQAALRARKLPIGHLDYDWSLDALRR